MKFNLKPNKLSFFCFSCLVLFAIVFYQNHFKTINPQNQQHHFPNFSNNENIAIKGSLSKGEHKIILNGSPSNSSLSFNTKIISNPIPKSLLIGINGTYVNPIQLKKTKIKLISTYKHYAKIAYCLPENVKSWSCGSCKLTRNFRLITTFYNTHTKAFAYLGEMVGENKLILAFRGSYELRNFWDDMKFKKRNMKVKDSRYDTKFLNTIKVHSGILALTDSLIDEIVQVINERYSKRIESYSLIIVGHSLGGAIGALSAIRLENQISKLNYTQISLYTYGQPRVGNAAFAQYFNSLAMTSVRVSTYGDMIPHLPPLALGYAHFNNEYFIHPTRGSKFCTPLSLPPYSVTNKKRWGLGRKKIHTKLYFEDPECSLNYSIKYKPSYHKNYLDDYMICEINLSKKAFHF